MYTSLLKIKMSSILLISPYNRLTMIAKKIVKSENIDVEIIEANILNFVGEGGTEELIKKINKDVKVVISRGMVAKVVRNNTSLPVIEIPVTTFDILDAISNVKNKGYKKVAIISVSNMLSNPERVQSLGDMQFHFISYENIEESLKKNMQSVHSKKYDAIIGDALSAIISNENGVYGVVLESNERSVKLALDNALKIVKHFEEEQNLQIKSRRKISELGWVAKYSFNDILGQSDEIIYSIYLAKKFAKSDNNVLIYGETGTGKELFAQSIHNESNRLYGPFIAVNCSALSENLLESELFGYEAGAFTGSNKAGKKGIFECAHKGTVFLDEISETSLNFQAKLLRVLQEGNIRKIGGGKVINTDVRIICATNRKLSEMVKQGTFREDIYYRLSQLELQIIPLRERKEDILIIAENFFSREIKKQKRIITYKDNTVFEPLLSYNWPGNVRELRNFILKLAVYCETNEITADYINDFFNNSFLRNKTPKIAKDISTSQLNDEKNFEIKINVSNDLRLMESQMYKQLLKYYNGNKKNLCNNYGISRTKLWRKLNY